MVVTGSWRGWKGTYPPVQGVGARLKGSSVHIHYLFVHKHYRGKTLTLTLHKSLDETEKVRVRWDGKQFRPEDPEWGDVWKGVTLERAST